MVKLIFASFFVLYLTDISYSQSHETERLSRRIDQLEAENARLIQEVVRLRQQQQVRVPYRYRDNQLRETTRSVDDLNRLRNSWERLTR